VFVPATVHARALDDITFARETLAAERNRFDLLLAQATQDLVKARADHATELAKREILQRQTAVQESFVEFLCQRVNQLEAERAIMLRHLTSVDVPVPTLHPRPVPADPPLDMAAALTSSIFDDDERHAPAGWHADGSVNYGNGKER